MAVDPGRRLFTVAEYHRMAEAGILDEDDRVELIDGEIFEMTPIGPRHADCVRRLLRSLIEGIGRRAVVGAQDPVVLSDWTEPQPDLFVARRRDEGYSTAHPEPADLLLVIEVADTTAVSDRNRKLPRYARTGVREVWLVDLEAGRLEVYRSPGEDGYQEALMLGPGDRVSPGSFTDVVLAVDEILSA